MKPLGTITMCFAHVDDDTITMLKSVMEDAENYADFTRRLCSRVCAEPTSALIEYLAFYFPFHIDDYNLTDKLEKEGKVPDLAKPLLMISKYRRGEVIYWDEMKQELAKAIKAAPNDWFATHLYMKWRIYAELLFPESDTDVKLIQRITKRVNENRDLEFYKSYLLRFKAIRAMFDHQHEDVVDLLNQALPIVIDHDEQIVVAHLLSVLAGHIKDTDVKEALGLLNASRELSEQLGYRYNIGRIQEKLAYIKGQRGELNAAIEHLLEYNEIRESLGLSLITLNGLFAFYYNQIGDGENALKRVDAAIGASKTLRRLSSFALAQRAWALTILGRFDEARGDLAASQELATKSGVAWYWFLWHQLVEGIIDKAGGRLDSASTAFMDVLTYVAENPVPTFQAICLLNLTEIEIDRTPLVQNTDSSGPWMRKLDEYVEMNDVPGFAAQALILKAKLFHKQGKHDESRRMLKEVRKIAKARSMKYLNNLVILMFPDIKVI